MKLTLESFSESRKIGKDEAIDYIKNCKNINKETAAYLTGYQILEKTLTDEDVTNILMERERKHKKAVKYAKKKKLELPKPDISSVVRNVFELVNEPFSRDHKDDFLPQLEGLVILLKLRDAKDNYSESLELLISMYNINYKNCHYFFEKWAMVLNEHSELMELYSKDEWFVIIFEDKLTLGASMKDGYPIYNSYKDCFFNQLKRNKDS
jgi:hypothetical protein